MVAWDVEVSKCDRAIIERIWLSLAAFSLCGTSNYVFQTIVVFQPRIIQEECRRAGHAASPSGSHVLKHSGGVHPAMQICFKLRKIQAGRFGVPVEIFRFQVLLVFKEQVVHHPEPALLGGGFRGFGGMLGKRMPIDEWKMPVDQAQLMCESLPESLDPDERPATERAFEIAICDHGYRR
jgi:hypothetical protein